jgi:hypothetical protein
MNWKNWVLVVLLNAVLVYGSSVWIFGIKFDAHEWIIDTLAVIALSLAWFGRRELIRGGHKQIMRTFAVCLVILLIPGLTKTAQGAYAEHLMYGAMALAGASFPLAFYLNRSRSKSIS